MLSLFILLIPCEGGTTKDLAGLCARFLAVTFDRGAATSLIRRTTSTFTRCCMFFPSPPIANGRIGKEMDGFDVKEVRPEKSADRVVEYLRRAVVGSTGREREEAYCVKMGMGEM